MKIGVSLDFLKSAQIQNVLLHNVSGTSGISVMSQIAYDIVDNRIKYHDNIDVKYLITNIDLQNAIFNSGTSGVSGNFLPLSGGTMSGDISMGTNSISKINTLTFAAGQTINNNGLLKDLSNLTSLDWQGRLLKDNVSNRIAIDYSNRFLKDSSASNFITVDWDNRLLKDSSNVLAINWANRQLRNSSGTVIMDWSSPFGSYIADNSGNQAIAFNSRTLLTSGGSTVMLWDSRQLIDASNVISIDWQSRALRDTSQLLTVDYGNRNILNASQTIIANWSGTRLSLNADPINLNDAATKHYVDNILYGTSGDYLRLIGGTMRGDINMGTNSISNVNHLTMSSGGYLSLGFGSTATRPGSPAVGTIRYNTTLNKYEGFLSNGLSTSWDSFVTENATQTLTQKTLVTPTILDGLSVSIIDVGSRVLLADDGFGILSYGSRSSGVGIETGTYNAWLKTTLLTNNRTFEFPDASGTLTLLQTNTITTDNAIVRFDSTSGNIQNSGVIIDDSNNITGINNLTISGDFIVLGNANYKISQSTITTSDATPTVIQTISTTTNSVYLIEARVLGVRISGTSGTSGDSASYIRTITTKNISGTLYSSLVQTNYTQEDIISWNVSFNNNGTNIELKVTGDLGFNINWQTTTIIQKIIF